MDLLCEASDFSADSTSEKCLNNPLKTLLSLLPESIQTEEAVAQIESKTDKNSSFRLVEQSPELLRDLGRLLGPKIALNLHQEVQKDQRKGIYNEHEVSYLCLLSQFETVTTRKNVQDERAALEALRDGAAQLLTHPEVRASENDTLVRELKTLLATLPQDSLSKENLQD